MDNTIITLAFLVLLLLLGFSSFLLYKDKLNGPTYASFVILIIILFIAFYSIDRLKELNVREGRIVLDKIDERKKNFDKEVSLLLDTLSELNAEYFLNEGMWTWEGPNPERLIKAKNISIRLLTLAGKNQEEIFKTTRKIDSRIMWAYLESISSDITETILKDESLKEKLSELSNKLLDESNIPNHNQLFEIVDLLKHNNIEGKFYEDRIEDMKFYLDHKTLRRPWSASSQPIKNLK